MAAPTFLFLKSELILCNICSPFLFCVWCYRLSLIRVGWYRAEALKLIFQGESPQQFSVFLPCCGASERRTSHVGEIRGPSICHLTALADRKPHHRDFLVHVEPFCQFAALWLKDVSWCLKSKQIIKNESNLNASREAAGRRDNTVLLMLYKWRERLILNLVNRKCTKVKAR